MSDKCIILAGGLGTRLQGVLDGRPKCLAQIGDRSFLDVLLHQLEKNGFDDFILSIGYLAEQVIKELKKFSESRFKIRTAVEVTPLGTGGAIENAMRIYDIDEAIVINGDTFIDADLSGIKIPLEKNELVRASIIDVDERTRYGGIQVINNKVISFEEKGCSGPGAINAGLYRVSKKIFDQFGCATPYSFEANHLQVLANLGYLGAVHLNGKFIDIGVPSDYYYFCDNYGRSGN